jgi:outer membrane protein OmpA-like peptidoglycan-associated protein
MAERHGAKLRPPGRYAIIQLPCDRLERAFFMIRISTSLIALAVTVATAVAINSWSPPAFAQSSTQIEDALRPKQPATRGLSRSLSADPRAATERKAIERARTRAISIEAVRPAAKEEREELAEIVKDKPKIDLEIFFDYNSDAIGPKAIVAVNALGEALIKPGLKGSVFVLNGHTDAAGSHEYNLNLSHRRAQSVRRYLIETYRIAPDTLLVAGFGKERLKLPHDPLAGQNRRVEVVNAGQ